jgi:hypothetical protein
MVSRTIYQVAVISFMAAVVWIGMGIYQALIKPPDSIKVDPAVLAPINPVIDTSVVGSMGTRIKFDQNLPDSVTPSPAPVASRSATATTSATINKGKTK